MWTVPKKILGNTFHSHRSPRTKYAYLWIHFITLHQAQHHPTQFTPHTQYYYERDTPKSSTTGQPQPHNIRYGITYEYVKRFYKLANCTNIFRCMGLTSKLVFLNTFCYPLSMHTHKVNVHDEIIIDSLICASIEKEYFVYVLNSYIVLKITNI